MADPYIDPATRIMRNKLGITDAAVLQKTEFEFSRFRARELAESPLKGNFDRPHLEKIHKYLFGDVYDWAGQERLYDVHKDEPILGGDGKQSVDYPKRGVPFGLDEQLDYTFKQLEKDKFLKGLEDDPERFASRFSKHMTEIWECHEFREGNTRTTTAFCRQLAEEAGYALADNFPPDARLFRDSLVLAAKNTDYERLQAQVDAGLDLARGPRRELEPEPTREELLDVGLRLEIEVEQRLDKLNRLHAIEMRMLEKARDETKEAHDTHLQDMASSPSARKETREEREAQGQQLNRKRIDTDVAVLNRRDDFAHERPAREATVRRDVAKDFPDDAALIRRGAEQRAFDTAVERWRAAVKGHQTEPANKAAAAELVDSIDRLQGTAANRARLSTVQNAKMMRQRDGLEQGRDRGRGMER